MTMLERKLEEQESSRPYWSQQELRETIAELGIQLAERIEEIRRKVEQQGRPLLKQARGFLREHPGQSLAGIALGSYIAGKLLRGRPRRRSTD